MMEAYLEVSIVIDLEVNGNVTYLCKPGKIKCANTQQPTKDLEVVHQNACAEDKAKELYDEEYCHEALSVQGTNIINLSKTTDFDFVPSFYSITVPLDSPGYTLTILLSLVSFVFSFIR